MGRAPASRGPNGAGVPGARRPWGRFRAASMPRGGREGHASRPRLVVPLPMRGVARMHGVHNSRNRPADAPRGDISASEVLMCAEPLLRLGFGEFCTGARWDEPVRTGGGGAQPGTGAVSSGHRNTMVFSC